MFPTCQQQNMNLVLDNVRKIFYTLFTMKTNPSPHKTTWLPRTATCWACGSAGRVNSPSTPFDCHDTSKERGSAKARGGRSLKIGIVAELASETNEILGGSGVDGLPLVDAKE